MLLIDIVLRPYIRRYDEGFPTIVAAMFSRSHIVDVCVQETNAGRGYSDLRASRRMQASLSNLLAKNI